MNLPDVSEWGLAVLRMEIYPLLRLDDSNSSESKILDIEHFLAYNSLKMHIRETPC